MREDLGDWLWCHYLDLLGGQVKIRIILIMLKLGISPRISLYGMDGMELCLCQVEFL